MTRKFLATALSALILLETTPVRSQESPPAPTSPPATVQSESSSVPLIQTRLGVGLTTHPETFLLVGSVEAQIDRFFSVGPMLQLGLASNHQLYIPTLGGRFTAPFSTSFKPMSVSILGGIGALIHHNNGFTFSSFAYSAGLNVDAYILKDFSVGLGGIVNVTESRTERVTGSVFATAGYRF